MSLSRSTHPLLALVAVLALLGLTMPTARAQEPTPVTDPAQRVVAEGPTGRVLLDLISPRATYAAGDVISLQYRFESKIDATQNVVVTSETVADASRCSWRNLPGQLTGKYNCTVDPRPSYTVTAGDAAAGRADITTVWTTTDPATGGTTGRIVHTKAIAVTDADPTPGAYLSVTMSRTDTLGAPVYEGQLLTYSFTYTNTGPVAITAFPRSSSIDGVAVSPAGGACRWADLRPGQSATCTSGWHLVTADDVAAGSFTPTTLWQATADRAGTVILQDGIVVTGDAVTTAPGAPEFREGVATTLAVAGSFGFTCHRIPALTEAPNGWLLASWDGRPGGCGDAPQANSIVQRISTDGGATWGPLTVIAGGRTAAPKYGYSDPSYVVDRETGTIFNFFVKSYDQGWGGSRAGTDPDDRNVLHAAVVRSTDNGLTWSEPAVITADITDEPDWTSRFAASGEGIQLRYGPHSGRLIQQYTVRDGGVMRAVSVYSDDHGLTWRAGVPVGSGMDENKVVELSNGDVMLNSRSSDSTLARKVAISADGGVTYGDVAVDHTLIDPRNNASIIRAFPDAPAGSARSRMLLFSNAASTAGRVNGTVRLSFDDGQTWSASKVFEPGAMSYSTLTPLSAPGTYGLFYEGAGYAMRYMQISLDWIGALPVTLGNGADPVVHRGTTSLTYTLTNVGDRDLAGLGVEPHLPTGWELKAVSPATVDLPAGESADVEVSMVVPATADPASHRIAATVTDGDRTASGAIAAELRLRPDENASQPVGLSLLGDLPAQPGQEAANMFDGDPATLWHTPWSGTVSLPLDVDLAVDGDPVDLASVSLLPRQAGANGRIRGFEVHAGPDVDSLVKVAEGVLANSPDREVIPISGRAGVVRLRVLSSYGDTADRWVSLAELSVTRAVPDDQPGRR